jgi:hypothetical protein
MSPRSDASLRLPGRGTGPPLELARRRFIHRENPVGHDIDPDEQRIRLSGRDADIVYLDNSALWSHALMRYYWSHRDWWVVSP